jgi:hypothetical protein
MKEFSMVAFPAPRASSWLGSLAGLVLSGLVLLNSRALSPRQTDLGKTAEEMCVAAEAFLKGLDADQAAKARFDFKDEERLNWHFIPRARKGLPLKEMKEEQRRLALSLLASGLSTKGTEKALTIMSLEQILREIEGPNGRMVRDPELYYFSVFGVPALKGVWGWRVEGHHLCINVTVVDGKAVSATPAFMGANPGEVKSGPRKGLRVLGNDEEMGRGLIKSLNEGQRKEAVFTQDAPKEVILVPGQKIRTLEPAGIAWGKLDGGQQEQLWTLVREYAQRLRPELADQDLAKIEKAGREKLSFAWAGGLERGEPHYYRIQGPTFVIEYDNVQNGANHVHSIWHDAADNFGAEILRRHHEQEHK